jgi:prepilin-type N-terminal cleavage/methylation domain-containing protein
MLTLAPGTGTLVTSNSRIERQKPDGADYPIGMRKHCKGFSLIELLIVVAIILIIAAIAIPNLLRSRIAANESSAVSSIRTVNTAEATYQFHACGSGAERFDWLHYAVFNKCLLGRLDRCPSQRRGLAEERLLV